jgi:hypothetical protein
MQVAYAPARGRTDSDGHQVPDPSWMGGADEQRSTGLAALRSAERKILSASSVHDTHEADFLMSECGMWMAESRIPKIRIQHSSF